MKDEEQTTAGGVLLTMGVMAWLANCVLAAEKTTVHYWISLPADCGKQEKCPPMIHPEVYQWLVEHRRTEKPYTPGAIRGR
jgi:hypothetical protein